MWVRIINQTSGCDCHYQCDDGVLYLHSLHAMDMIDASIYASWSPNANGTMFDMLGILSQVSQQEAERRKTSAGDSHPTSPSASQQPGAPSTAAAPAPQQPAPAASQPASGQQANAEFEEKVARLMALGCSRAECEAALRRANGNEDMAGALLFGGDF